MQWKEIGKLGAIGVSIAACLMALVWFISAEESSNVQARDDVKEIKEIDAEPVYLAFSSVVEAGVSYSVNDSYEFEYLAEDEDNEPNDPDEQEDDYEEEDYRYLDEYDLELSDEQAKQIEQLAYAEESKKTIKGSIDPGVYVTPFATKDCEYELWRIMENGEEQLIGSDAISEGRLIVNINGIEPDRFYSTEGCIEWSEWSQLEEPIKSISNGDYWTGDLQPGTWKLGIGCTWERVIDFRGALLTDSKDSGIYPGEIGIGKEDLGIRVRGCKSPIKFESDDIAEDLRYEESEYETVSESYYRRY